MRGAAGPPHSWPLRGAAKEKTPKQTQTRLQEKNRLPSRVRAGQNARLGKNCSLSRFELVCDAREAALRLGLRASPKKIASGRL